MQAESDENDNKDILQIDEQKQMHLDQKKYEWKEYDQEQIIKQLSDKDDKPKSKDGGGYLTFGRLQSGSESSSQQFYLQATSSAMEFSPTEEGDFQPQSEDNKLKAKQKSSGKNLVKKEKNRSRSRENSIDSARKKSLMETNKIMQADCYYREDKQVWKRVSFTVDIKKIVFGSITLQLDKIAKIKIFPTKIQGLAKKITIKLSTLLGNQFFLAFTKASRYGQYPLPFFSFGRIISKKLKQRGVLKATEWKTYSQLEFSPKKNEHSSSHDSEPENKKTPPFIAGKIYKKSKFLRKWQEREIMIDKNGLHSFKFEKIKLKNHYCEQIIQNKQTFTIETGNIQYIWTWFQCISQKQLQGSTKSKKEEWQNDDKLQKNKFLIVKVMHQMKTKTQFAIPICDFANKNSYTRNWLLAFYRIL